MWYLPQNFNIFNSHRQKTWTLELIELLSSPQGQAQQDGAEHYPPAQHVIIARFKYALFPSPFHPKKNLKQQVWLVKGQKLKGSARWIPIWPRNTPDSVFRATMDTTHYKFSFNLGYCRPGKWKILKNRKKKKKKEYIARYRKRGRKKEIVR